MKPVSIPFVITWTDLCFVWRKYSRWMLRAALGSVLLGSLVFFFVPTRYTAKALFREGSGNTSLPSFNLPSFLLSSTNQASGGSAIVMIQTDQIMGRVVQELGLQIQIGNHGKWRTLLQHVYDNILLLRGREREQREVFTFREVRYSGRKSLNFSLLFKDPQHYVLCDEKGKVLAEASLGETVSIPEVAFSLVQTSSSIVLGKRYTMHVSPWECATSDLLKRLEIRPEKLDKSLLNLFYSHSDRAQASFILDRIMAAYLQYLKQENDRIAQQQLEFLDRRQEQFGEKFEKELDNYLACLNQNVNNYGFFEAEQQVEFLTVPQQQLKSKLIELDNLFDRLKKVQASYDYAVRSEVPASFEQQPFQAMLASTEKKPSIPLPKWQKNRMEQFAGMDLGTAQELHTGYQRELDGWQERVDRISFILPRIHRKDFDLNALSALTQDPVTANLVNRASELVLQLQDAGNRSQKDLIRIEESLSVQKTFIAQHLKQSLELNEQNAFITQQKLARLREVMLKLIEEEKSVNNKKLQEIRDQLAEVPTRWKLEKHLQLKNEIVRKMVEGITQMVEGKTLEHHLKQINSKIVDTARCPLYPKRASFSMFVAMFVCAGMGIAYLFFFCRLFLRGFPLSESTARVLEMATGGTFGPLCDAPLQELPHRDAESLRSLADFIQEKQQKKKIYCAGLGSGAVVAIAGSRRPPFVRNLARLLAMREAKVLILDASFEFAQTQDQNGSLWDYLTGKSSNWQPQRNEGFDVLPSGATGRFCTELLHKERFAELLAQVSREYDVVLFVNSGIFATNEVNRMLEKSDALILAIQEETIEQLERTGLVERLKEPMSARVVFNERLS